jgi:hypothetical protein
VSIRVLFMAKLLGLHYFLLHFNVIANMNFTPIPAHPRLMHTRTLGVCATKTSMAKVVR